MNQPHLPKNQLSRGRWVYAGSLLISFSLAVALAAAFSLKHVSPVSSALLTLVLLALALAVGLHTHYLLRLRRDHRNTAKALTTTEHEFQSIFDGALDGFVILDDQGHCLETNPATLAILGVTRQELIGHAIRDFLGENAFEVSGSRHASSEIQLVRRDGQLRCLEYAKTTYMAGRHSLILRDISERKRAEVELRESRQQFVEMAENIAEVFWTIDAASKRVLYVNPAFETLTGRALETLRVNPTSYQELFHPEDSAQIMAQLDEASRSGHFDEEFRIVRPDRAVRWVLVRGTAVRNSSGKIYRLVGTAQDITARKSAEEDIARSLKLAQSAWAEADALRKTTLALTQNLSMDYVLDTLLASLLALVPCDSAQVLLAETDELLFLARAIHARNNPSEGQDWATTWNASNHPPLLKVLVTRNITLVRDTAEQDGWKQFKGHARFRSWLGVPLIASGEVLGVLSLGDSKASFFTDEYLRLAKSLAIPAAVAIQNARLYERAAIYGAELEKRVADLEKTERALEKAEKRRAFREKVQ